jgi:hypothetical protein
MAAIVQQIPSTRTATCASTGISRPTSLGDGSHLRKAAKTKRNELKFAFGLAKDGNEEEKVVKELSAEVKPTKVALSCLLEPAVGSQSGATDGNDIAAVAADDCRRLVTRKRHSPVSLHRTEGDRRTPGVLRNHLPREAVVNAWQDEQSKVNPLLSCFSH